MGATNISAVSFTELDTMDIGKRNIWISLVELEQELLASITPQDMTILHKLTDVATDLVWLTGANMLGSPNPGLTLVNGLSRSLMLEQPALRFTVVDVESFDIVASQTEGICHDVAKVLHGDGVRDDTEFIRSSGLLNISRFGPDVTINSLFQRRLGIQEPTRLSALGAASLSRLSVGPAGGPDSLYFQQLCKPSSRLPPGFVDVRVKAVSLNAEDVYTIDGRQETQSGTLATDFTGIITAADPSSSSGLKVGDRVVVSAPNSFSTTERVPVWSAQKILPDEDFARMATLPLPYCAALYALRDRANLRTGETVLIQSGAGAFGIAAISIAQRIGATVYTSAGSPKRRGYLSEKVGIPSTHVFDSHDSGFINKIKELTNGQGVDVVLNCLGGDLASASWECVADFGRFVEVSKRSNSRRLDVDTFSQNVTFTAVDFTALFFSDKPYHRRKYTM